MGKNQENLNFDNNIYCSINFYLVEKTEEGNSETPSPIKIITIKNSSFLIFFKL